MALKATKAEVWAVGIDDHAGGVADKLERLADAGASFEMVFARRTRKSRARGCCRDPDQGNESDPRRPRCRDGHARNDLFSTD